MPDNKAAKRFTFDDIFELVKGHEGHYSLDPRDKGNWTGGEIGKGILKGTKFGISAGSYPDLDICNLTVDQARLIYLDDFWMPLVPVVGNNDPLLAPYVGVMYTLFDATVNCGWRAVKWYQEAVGSRADGRIGPATIKASIMALDQNLDRVLRTFHAQRMYHYMLQDAQDDIYGFGWALRVFDVHDTAKKMARKEDLPCGV